MLDIKSLSASIDGKKILNGFNLKIKLDQLLTMNRKTGFYQMIEMMIERIKNVGN